MIELYLELQTVLQQGGVVLWIMLGLSVILYTLLSSTWLTLRHVKKGMREVKRRIEGMTDRVLIQDEVYLFEMDEIAWVKRRMPSLSVLLALAPLSGLLGTVSGMLNTFAGLAQSSTTKPIDSISSGISEALITTQVGLLIAIPGAFMYAFVRKRLEHVTENLHQFAAQQTIKISQ